MELELSPFVLQQLSLFHPFPLCIVFTLSLICLLKSNRARYLKPQLPPSPPKLPIIGNLHQLGKVSLRRLRDLTEKYGPLMLLHFGARPILLISSAEIAREVMNTHDTAFANRPSTTAARTLLYGGLDLGMSPYSDYWRQVKKICVTELLSIKRVQFFRFVREEEVAIFMRKISSSSSMGVPINLSEMIKSLSNDIISRCALGMKYEGKDGKNKFGEVAREFTKCFAAFCFGDFFPLLGWVDVLTGLVSKMKKISEELDTFLDQVIDNHITRSRHDEADYTKDFVDTLLHIQKNNFLNLIFTRHNIKAILVDMFVGETDTTAAAIENVVAELIRNPNVMSKVQKEIRKVVGRKEKIEEHDLYETSYMHAVVKEALRLHPPAAIIPRETSTATTIKGFHVPPKTTVFVNVWAIQTDPKKWDRSEEFIPERFLDSNIDFNGHDYELIPFGSGRRGCPGMLFGLATIELTIANLLYWYDWKLTCDTNMNSLFLFFLYYTSLNGLPLLVLYTFLNAVVLYVE